MKWNVALALAVLVTGLLGVYRWDNYRDPRMLLTHAALLVVACFLIDWPALVAKL